MSMDIDGPPAVANFELRCELHGHVEDVRGLCASEIGLFTSSRDKTIKQWVEESPTSYQLLQTLVGHTGYVGPVIYLAPGDSADYPQGVVVSGSRDTHLIVWDPNTASPLVTLEGHQYQITALASLPTGEIVSTSLDKTLRIWRGGKCVRVLEGHAGPVLSLIVVPQTGDILSGSGDTTIKRWNAQGSCTATLTGHTDTVRSLCLLPNIGFVSASHDLTLRVWGPTGDTLATLVGHTAIIYCCAATESGFVASGSEDNTTRVWRASGECLQVIDHPSNIWDVRFLADDDLVTGCADAVARIWSRQPERQATAEAAAALTNLVAEARAAKAKKAADEAAASDASLEGQLPAGLKVVAAHELGQPGAKDGETKCVREGGGITAYAWDATNFKWEKLGEVVAGPSGGGGADGGGGGGDNVAGGAKKWFQGREWDFVFDVDISDNAPPLKLPLNMEENPYIVADRFLEANELPPGYKDQIVQFILTNTGQDKKPNVSSMPITGGGVDPLTGGSSGGQDYANAGRASVPMQPFSATGGGVDPFTGGASSSSRAAPMPPPAAPSTFLVFDNVPGADALHRKLCEFNGLLAAQGGADVLPEAVTAPQGGLTQTLAKMPALASGAASASASVFSADDHALLSSLLRWPAPHLFPGLDLARIVVLDAGGAARLAAEAGSFDSPLPGTLAGALDAAAAEPALATNQQLGLRLAANCFKTVPLRSWALAQRSGLLDRYAPCCSSGGSKALRLSMATLLANYATALHMAPARDGDAKMQVLSALVELLGNTPLVAEEDTAVRSFSAVAVLLRGDAEMCDLARGLGVDAPVAAVNAAPGAPNRLLKAAVEVVSALATHPPGSG